MNIKETLFIVTKKLQKNKIQTPQFDAEVLLSFVLKKTREFILAHPEKKLSSKQIIKFNSFIKRRLSHEPIAYILGHKEFYGLDFKVNKHTLIPRPETEHLVDTVISNLQLVNSKKIIIADIGTGSGNIIVSIAKKIEKFKLQFANCQLFAVDISKKALDVAKQNAKKNKVADKIKFIQGNLIEPLIGNYNLKIGNLIILANLPYLSEKIYSKISLDIKNFEPKSALLSGIDGLDHYEKLFQQIKNLQIKNCKLKVILEISPEQKQRITKLIKKYFSSAIVKFQKDLAGKWRVVSVKI